MAYNPVMIKSANLEPLMDDSEVTTVMEGSHLHNVCGQDRDNCTFVLWVEQLYTYNVDCPLL